MRELVEGRFGYDASLTMERMRAEARMDETCQGTVPQAGVDQTDARTAWAMWNRVGHPGLVIPRRF